MPLTGDKPDWKAYGSIVITCHLRDPIELPEGRMAA